MSSGEALGVCIGGATATASAQADTTPFGFVDYCANGQSVTLARPLAVAETYGGQNGTDAIVRIRQNSTDDDSLSFYRVDNLQGTIDGIAPGQIGYGAAALTRTYTLSVGGTSVTGPGNGQFLQTEIEGVNNGDIIGFEQKDATSGKTTWGLASQNAGGSNALWSYGSGTWGFDDGSAGGGGFDSMVFQLDFTSNAGHALLANDVACFVERTRLLTARGEMAVEHLAVGDLVVTAAGGMRPIRWLGHRTIDLHRHPRPHDARPIRIAAHAFDANRPARDLLVSPGHAICVDATGDVLIPAAALVNGATIVQLDVANVTYWHVELDAHDIVLAENLPAESYLDMGNRSFFAEAAAMTFHARPDAPIATPVLLCRPIVVDGPRLEMIRAQLAARTKRMPARRAKRTQRRSS